MQLDQRSKKHGKSREEQRGSSNVYSHGSDVAWVAVNPCIIPIDQMPEIARMVDAKPAWG